MKIYDVATIGAGPAGLVVSIEAAKMGAKVVVLDSKTQAGGQLIAQTHKFYGSPRNYAGVRGFRIAETLLELAKSSEIEFLLNSEVVGVWHPEGVEKVLVASRERRLIRIAARRVVIATGAQENSIPFPGWTMPGVLSAGAAQTLMNLHGILPGNNILMIGSGNIGLIVAYQLVQAGARVVSIIEANPNIVGWNINAAKVLRLGVPILVSSTVKEVLGKGIVEKAIVTSINENGEAIAESEKTFNVDCVCLAVGLTPNIRLTKLAGCKHVYISVLGGWTPLHNHVMETTVDGIYVAGDVAGVEAESVAIEEGRLAGIGVAESLNYIKSRRAQKLQKSIENHLEQIRSGSFGKRRNSAKRWIVMEYCARKE